MDYIMGRRKITDQSIFLLMDFNVTGFLLSILIDIYDSSNRSRSPQNYVSVLN